MSIDEKALEAAEKAYNDRADDVDDYGLRYCHEVPLRAAIEAYEAAKVERPSGRCQHGNYFATSCEYCKRIAQQVAQPGGDDKLSDENLDNIMKAHLDGVYLMSTRALGDRIVSVIIRRYQALRQPVAKEGGVKCEYCLNPTAYPLGTECFCKPNTAPSVSGESRKAHVERPEQIAANEGHGQSSPALPRETTE